MGGNVNLRQLASAAAAAVVGLLPALAQAQSYPSRPIRLIVPFTPGTTTDSLARLLGPQVSQRWGVPVIVDNRSGASGIVGMEAAANANPDGHTFLFSGTAFGTLAATAAKLPYDPRRSFSSVMMLGASPLTLVVASKFPAATVRELIEQARRQPGVINYATSGAGSVFHLTMEWLKQDHGINLVHVPYKGTTGVTADLIAGHVPTSLMVLQTIAPHAQAGRVRLLAVLGSERAAQFPQVPTMAEAGVPGMVVEAWAGVTAPARTPRAIIGKLNAEINRLIALPENRETLTRLGIRVIGGAPDVLDKTIRSEIARWTEVVRRGNIRVE